MKGCYRIQLGDGRGITEFYQRRDGLRVIYRQVLNGMIFVMISYVGMVVSGFQRVMKLKIKYSIFSGKLELGS